MTGDDTPGEVRHTSPVIDESPSSDGDSSDEEVEGEDGSSNRDTTDASSDDTTSSGSHDHPSTYCSPASPPGYGAPSAVAPPRSPTANAIDVENEITIQLHILLESGESEMRICTVNADTYGYVCFWTVRHSLQTQGGLTPGRSLEVRRNCRWTRASWYVAYRVKYGGALVLRTVGADTNDWQIDIE